MGNRKQTGKKKIKDAQGPVRTTAKDPPFMLSES